MSLSVLVGQQARWEGDAKTRHRVAIPPDQETLTKIRELVSGATGLDAARGDQLIVETLPFESVMNVEYPQSISDPKTAKPTPDPEWLRQIKANSWGIPVAIGVVLLVLTLVWIILRKIALFFMTRKKPSGSGKKKPGMEGRAELPAAANLMNTLRPENDKSAIAAKTDQAPTAEGAVGALEAAKDSMPAILSAGDQELAFAEKRKESIRRIHELVENDMPGTVAVLRSWLQGEA
jgi:flagellar M-ring protein FliF